MARRPRRRAALGLVYDMGALIAAEADDRRMWAIHTRAIQRGVMPIVPAGCLIEAWRGTRQTSLSRLLDGCAVESLDGEAARRAGSLRRALSADVGPIDASVVETALRLGCAVVTSDRSDIERLASAVRRRIDVIDV